MIGRLDSSRRGKSLNRKSWCSSRPNTWLMEPWVHRKRLVQHASLSRLANARRIFQYRTNLRKERSSIRSRFNGGSGRDGVKGQDERQNAAPLTPPRPQRELPVEKVIDRGRRCHTWGTGYSSVVSGGLDVRVETLTYRTFRDWASWYPTHSQSARMDGASAIPLLFLGVWMSGLKP